MEVCVAKANGPITVCVINLKGGVGKSTITALLARRAFNDKKKNVLAIDLDPQANLSQGLMRARYNAFLANKRPSIVEIFAGYVPPSKAAVGPKPLGPATAVETIMADGTRTLQLIPSRFDFSDALIDAVRPDPRVLAKHLSNKFQDKDLILIDCAPTESILTRAAYHASSLVLIPVKPEFFATVGFPLLQQSLVAFRSKNRAHQIDVSGVVINNAFYDGGNDGGPEKAAAMIDITAEAKKNGWHIFGNEIPHSRGFPKLMRGDTSYSGNAWMFSYFANEFFKKIGL
jgi:chromosome partitioning protein